MQENDEQRRKCIGVIIAKPDRDYQTGLLCGIYRSAFAHDMNVAVFAVTLAGGVEFFKESELDIYTLPNYDRLSGVIFVPGAFDYEHTDELVTKPLIKAAKEKGLPVVAVDCETEGIASVTSDDSDIMRSLLEHMIVCHGCRDIAFMTGTRGNPFSENLLDVYRQTMSGHGLAILPEREYYGDFWYNEGENFVKRLMDSADGLPEAIVCANGPMARSVYRALRKHGYVVPDDILIACNTDEPGDVRFITSVSKKTEAEGYAACERLVDIMNGGEPGGVTVVKCGCDINASLTCGCLPAAEYDHSQMEGIDINAPNSYFSEFNFMSADLLNRPGHREMFWTLDWYTTYIPGIRGIYFCLCDDWGKPCDEEDLIPGGETGAKRRIGYTKNIQPYYYRINNDDGTHESVFENSETFPLEEMFPRLFDASGEPSSYIFRSLHFVERNFGYIVIDNGSRMHTYDLAFDYWIRNVANAMEYQRKLGNEKYLYSSDFMTGLINRNGFNRMMPGIISEARRGDYQLLFAVCDLNGLKFINDTFGHVEGDNSIRTAAEAICKSDFPGLSVEKNFRIGGDEFVKAVIGRFTPEEVENFRKRIYDHLDEYNKTSGKPYPVYLSVGVTVKEPEDEYTPDSLISEADKLMFADKLRIKKLTGFDPKRAV